MPGCTPSLLSFDSIPIPVNVQLVFNMNSIGKSLGGSNTTPSWGHVSSKYSQASREYLDCLFNAIFEGLIYILRELDILRNCPCARD